MQVTGEDGGPVKTDGVMRIEFIAPGAGTVRIEDAEYSVHDTKGAKDTGLEKESGTTDEWEPQEGEEET